MPLSTMMSGVAYESGALASGGGPCSVDGWLGAVVAKELGGDVAELLDVEARELVIEGQRVPLTPLEFSVMSYPPEDAVSACPFAECKVSELFEALTQPTANSRWFH